MKFLQSKAIKTQTVLKWHWKHLHLTAYSLCSATPVEIKPSPYSYLAFNCPSPLIPSSLWCPKLLLSSQPTYLHYCFPHLLLLLWDPLSQLLLIPPLSLLKCLLITSDTSPCTSRTSAQFGVSPFLFFPFPHSCSSTHLLPFSLGPFNSWQFLALLLCLFLLLETFLTSNPSLWLQCYQVSLYFSLRRHSHERALFLCRSLANIRRLL